MLYPETRCDHDHELYEARPSQYSNEMNKRSWLQGDEIWKQELRRLGQLGKDTLQDLAG